MFKILLIISVITAICCMCLVIACLFTSTEKYELPDIADFEFVEPLELKIEKRKVFTKRW